MQNTFISCDWGTSSFRARLIDAATGNILAETRADQGIAATYALWQQQLNTNRVIFYADFIQQQINVLEHQLNTSLEGVIIILSGMASASIGMMELPYKSIPFKLKDASPEIHLITATATCRHNIILVSGVRSANDVMRGEETMMMGCSLQELEGQQLFIFPGTHSKHVIVEKEILKDFKTYMTGEIFDLLSKKSILAASVEAGDLSGEAIDMFILGVKESARANVLNSIFHVRTSQLFNRAGKKENYHYLSGLLIGQELKEIDNDNYAAVTVIAAGNLSTLYLEALLSLDCNLSVKIIDADKTLINGQAIIYKQHQNKF